jgi:hypothetical protein
MEVRAELDAMQKCPCRESNPDHPGTVYVGVRVPWFVCDTCVSQVLIAVKCAVAGSFVDTGV